MSVTMYQASIPVFIRALNNLGHVLERAEHWAGEKNIAGSVLLGTRLTPDMFPLVRQVQIASDMVKLAAARLAQVQAPVFADEETSFAELQQRLQATREFLGTIQPEQLEDSATRAITVKQRSGEQHFVGVDYLFQFVLPNLFFHCTTAYDILRQAGVPLGKRDYLNGSDA
ncbi:DUF1993 domain-containing protein [Frateuria aurantia]